MSERISMMKYKEIKPAGFLRNFVECFWGYENENAEIEHTILPDGYFDLIAEFNNDTLAVVKLTGVWTKAVHVTIPKSTKILAIRFKLLAAEYLFQQEIKSISDTTRLLALDFWEIDAYQGSDFEKFTSGMTDRLNDLIRNIKKMDDRKVELFELIYQNNNKTVEELSQDVVWNRRQISRYFNSRFGFPLKEFLRIVRCNSSYQDIASGKLSPQKDYFDQAHFIKELKKYTGTTPKRLFKNENDRFLQLSKGSRD